MNDRRQVKESKTLKSLNPLIVVCKFLAILPPNSKSILYNAYPLILQVIFVCGFLHSAYGKQTSLFDSYSSPAKVIDQIANLFLTLANITSISLTSFCYRKKYKKLFRDITYFDNRVCVPERKGNIFWISVVLLHLLVGAIILSDWWVWTSSVSFKMYKYYTVRDFQFYHLSLTVMLVFWMTVEFTYRFKYLNQSLEIISKKLNSKKIYSCKEHVDGSLFRFTNYEYNDVKHIAKMYNFLSDVLMDFNAIFGFIILFAVLFFIAFIVQYAVELIIYTLIGDDLNGNTFGLGLQLVSVLWIFQCMITLLTLAVAGDHLSLQSVQTSTICYKILNITDVSSTHDLELLREELKLLAEQVSCRRPRLAASGFFDVNFAMMGFIVTSVTSYIIVTIQFLT